MNHKSFDFTKLGGFPLEQERLSWMQQSYTEALQAVSSLIGDNVIVSGCVVAGSNVTDGWVVVGGELLPFKGGVKQDTFSIRNIATALEFEDASFKEVQFYKYCEFGTDNPINFDSLTRLKTVKDIVGSIKSIDTSIEELSRQIITGSVHYVWDNNLTQKQIRIDTNGAFDASEYIGFLNNAFSLKIVSSFYSGYPTSFDFVINRSDVDFTYIEGDLQYVLIKKQN